MIYVITGPTGSGKSSLAMTFAKAINGQIINADAFQVYKYMDVGTNKATVKEQAAVKHHLLDIVAPSEGYDVASYQNATRAIISKLSEQKIPIIMCGGSGLYIRATLYDYVFPPQELKTNSNYQDLTNAQLYDELKRIDNEAAMTVHQNNRRRVMRALEIYARTGRSKSEHLALHRPNLLYNALFVGLKYERDQLYALVDARVDTMIQKGLIEEVKSIVAQFGLEARALQAIGYKQVLPYLKNECTLEQAIADIKTATRHYVKRQFTFFNRQLPMHWFDTKEEAKAFLLREFHLHE